MASRRGPVVMQAAGDTFIDRCHINTVIWVYKGSTAGNEAVLKQRQTNELICQFVTDATNTYLGANLGPSGISCPEGFHAPQLDGGKLLVFLREN